MTRLFRPLSAASLAVALALTGSVGFADVAHAAPSSSTVFPQSSVLFPGNDGKPHSVTFDEHSFMVDGQRLNIWSGEIHYWRLPDVNGWRDVLQKMRANGYNAVSLYFFWGMHQSEENGTFDFTENTVKDLDLLLRIAEEEGLYVIARPGPYVNAEISMGGLPAYMSNYGGGLRSTDSKALAASKSWLEAVDAIIAKHQVTTGGGSVLLYQVENELVDANRQDQEFLKELVGQVKTDGITVPTFHNDYNLGGRFRDTSSTGLDFYAYDSYPVGFNCSAPRNAINDSESGFRAHAPNSPHFITESQGGAFTPWGASFNASDCYQYTDEAFTRQWGAHNIGNGVTAFNFYMAFGGTNWGWTGSPASGFTSYDYGAGITEDRTLTAKAGVQKEIGYYTKAVPELAGMSPVTAPIPSIISGSAVNVYSRLNSSADSVTGNGARTLALRLANSNDETPTSFTLPLSLGKPKNGPEHKTVFSTDDRDPSVVYKGQWQAKDDPTAWKNTVTTSTNAGDSLSFAFKGSGIRLITTTGTDHGPFTVSIDDEAPVEVTTAHVDTEQNKPLQFEAFKKEGLTPGEHRLTVTNTGAQVVGIDALDVLEPLGDSPIIINDSETSTISFTGEWQHATGQSWTAGDIDGDETFSKTAGDSFTFAFEGVGFDIIAPYSENHGSATVEVDDTPVGKTEETTSNTPVPQQTVFSWRSDDASAPARHKVTVSVDGTPFAGSSGTYVSLDALRIFPSAASLPGGTPPSPDDGSVMWPRIPQKEGTTLTLQGRDALLLTADKKLAGRDLYYTTSQLFGPPLATDAGHVQYLVAAADSAGETVLHYSDEPTVLLPDGVEKTWDGASGQLRINYVHGDAPQDISITDTTGTLVLRVIDRKAATTTWLLDGTNGSDAFSAAVEGVELARTVRMEGASLAITGSASASGEIRVLLPVGTASATWNGKALGDPVAGVSTGSVEGPSAVSDQELRFVSAQDDSEAGADYDDSSWVLADATASKQSEEYTGILRYGKRDENQQGPGQRQKVVLDSNHYGFHSGSVWYRAAYTADADDPELSFLATASKGAPQQGENPGFAQIWVNGAYAGAIDASGGWQSVSAPKGSVKAGEKVLVAVLVHNLGLSLDWNNGAWGSISQSKENRGLFDAELANRGPVTWRIKGASAASARIAEKNPSGTIYNNGGLGGEERGWHMPSFDDSTWVETSDLHARSAGVHWYRAHVSLDVPEGQDTAFRLEVDSERFASRDDKAQMTIFVNGWNTGVYIGDKGPQSSFTVPSAFLNPRGDNVIAVALAAKESGMGPESMTLRALHSTTLPAQSNPQPQPDPQPQPTPSVEVSPSRATRGSAVTITGRGYAADSQIEAVLHSDPIVLGRATSDASGTVSLTVKIPENTALGTHQVVLTQVGTSSSASTPLEVVEADQAGTPPPNRDGDDSVDRQESRSGGLASTGSIAALVVTSAALLLGAGLLVRRRRVLLVE